MKLSFCIFFSFSLLLAFELSLDNEHSGQRRDGSQLWDIVFDVEGLDDMDSLEVDLKAFTQSGEELTCVTLSGDYPKIYGSGKKMIVWNIGADEPGREFYSDSILIRLTLHEPGVNVGWCNVDVVIIFDTTGSMFSSITDARENIDLFTDSLEASGFDYRLGLVTFGDGTNFPHGYDMTVDPDEFHDWIWAIGASGGGDGPETSLDGIADAINLYHWRAEALHIVLMITDADFHELGDGTGFSDETPEGVLALITETETVCFIVSPDDSIGWLSTYCYNWYLNFTSASGGNWYLIGTSFDSIYLDIVTLISDFD